LFRSRAFRSLFVKASTELLCVTLLSAEGVLFRLLMSLSFGCSLNVTILSKYDFVNGMKSLWGFGMIVGLLSVDVVSSLRRQGSRFVCILSEGLNVLMSKVDTRHRFPPPRATDCIRLLARMTHSWVQIRELK
jgi:hypothetical protein